MLLFDCCPSDLRCMYLPVVFSIGSLVLRWWTWSYWWRLFQRCLRTATRMSEQRYMYMLVHILHVVNVYRHSYRLCRVEGGVTSHNTESHSGLQILQLIITSWKGADNKLHYCPPSQAKALATEVYRWIGAAVKPSLEKSLKPVQVRSFIGCS